MNEPVIIDPEFQSLLPPLEPEEREKLKILCQRDGIEDPLKVWHGILIDGHNRYEIAEEYDLNYEIKDKSDDLATRADVMQWILDNQASRRNLSKSQLVAAYNKYEEERAKEAKEKQLLNLKQNTEKKNFSSRKDHVSAVEEVAQKIGVSVPTYRDMKLITNEGTPEQIERMNKGGKGNGVSRIAKEIKESKEQPEEKKPEEKRCPKCKRMLPKSAFFKSYGRPDGLTTYCMECDRERRREERAIQKRNAKAVTGACQALYDEEIPDITIADVVEELTENFTTSIGNLKRILENYKDIVMGNKAETQKMWSNLENIFQVLKEEYE